MNTEEQKRRHRENEKARYWRNPEESRAKVRRSYWKDVERSRYRQRISHRITGDIQESARYKGLKWEKYVAEKYFKNAKLTGDENYFGWKKEYDLDTEIGTVDVKSVNAWFDERKKTSRWHFWIRPRIKQFTPNYYFLVCLVKEVVTKCYLIPGKECSYRLTLGNSSLKWDRYLV